MASDTPPAPAGLRDLGRRTLEVESNSVLIATVALILFIGVIHPDFLAWGQLKDDRSCLSFDRELPIQSCMPDCNLRVLG